MTPEDPPCKPCNIARTVPAYPLFSPACIYCGARIIQLLGTLPIDPIAIRDRRLANLAVWVEFGHSEQTIRQMAKAKEWCIGPASVTASEDRSRTKRR